MALTGCAHCGLVVRVTEVPRGRRACCPRCEATVRDPDRGALGHQRTAAIAIAGLILYPLAVGLPILRIEKFGHVQEASVIEGVSTLLARGHVVVGLVVLACSVVFPVAKLLALLILSAGGMGLGRQHKALTWRLVDLTGRWGMLDVLLVAVLVAVLKLGDWVQVSVGPAALAFALCVGLSLAAAASFDPQRLWEPQP